MIIGGSIICMENKKNLLIFYSLEVRQKLKHFKAVFLDTGKKFLKFNLIRIKNKSALMCYITQPSPMIICDS